MRQTASVGVIVLLIGSLAWAQAATGVIEGTLVDGRGQPVIGAIVTARHVATDTPYRMTTNDLGQYKFATVPPGTYEVTTPAPAGAGTAVQIVKVTMGSVVTANFDPSTPLAKKKEALGAGERPVRFEVSGRVGWTFSDGVGGNGILASDGNVYNSLDPADSLSWGFTFGAFMTPRAELEFLFGRQQTTLQANGTNTIDVADFTIAHYHGVFSYHFGKPAAAIRPYAMGGLGATNYSSLSFTGADGQSRQINPNTRWSSTFGGGVKIYRGRVGARVEARLTPTIIRSTATGWWCDPYWGCYVTEKSQYSKQFEMSGGLSFRF